VCPTGEFTSASAGRGYLAKNEKASREFRGSSGALGRCPPPCTSGLLLPARCALFFALDYVPMVRPHLPASTSPSPSAQRFPCTITRGFVLWRLSNAGHRALGENGVFVD
jgi:hypothetical protein